MHKNRISFKQKISIVFQNIKVVQRLAIAYPSQSGGAAGPHIPFILFQGYQESVDCLRVSDLPQSGSRVSPDRLIPIPQHLYKILDRPVITDPAQRQNQIGPDFFLLLLREKIILSQFCGKILLFFAQSLLFAKKQSGE